MISRSDPSAGRRTASASPASGNDLDELTDAFVTTGRALVALAVRSINAAPVEVTLMQHRVLVLLAAHGEQSVSALAEQLGVNASNASRVCDRLQRLGLVSRRRSTTDARTVKVAITTGGADVLRAVTEHRRAEVRRVLGTVPEDVARRTVEALRMFNEAAHEVSDDSWALARAKVRPTELPGSRSGRR